VAAKNIEKIMAENKAYHHGENIMAKRNIIMKSI